MLQDFYKTLMHSPKDLVEDVVGLMAVFVVIMVGLSVPGMI